MKKSVALVLSSGGSKGLAHIGVINELEKQGFKITSISGSSIGSVYGGLHAMGKLHEYTEWVKTLKPKSIWDLMDFTISTNGLLKGEKVFQKMKTFIPDMPIEDLNIPFAAVATDLLNEVDVVFDSGSYYEAIRASIAIPSVFTPVKFKDTILVDGGVLNPIPIEHVKRNKDDILVVVNLYGKKESNSINADVIETNDQSSGNNLNGIFKSISKFISSGDRRSLGYFSLLSTTTHAMVHKIAKQSIEKHQPDITISIPYDSSNTFDFHKADKMIEMGEIAARKAIMNYLNSDNHENISDNMRL